MKLKTHSQTEYYCSILPRLDASYSPRFDYYPFVASDPPTVWVELGWLWWSLILIVEL